MTAGALPPDKARRWVGVGTGRSGTGWTAALATELGSRTCHEDPVYWWAEDRAGEGWPYFEGTVSLAAIRWAADWPTDWPVVHVIRDPVAVVASFVRTRFFAESCPCHEPGAHLETPYGLFLARHAPAALDPAAVADLADPEDRDVARTCRYVVEWNLRCEAVLGPYLRFPVDRVDFDAVRELAAFAWGRPADDLDAVLDVYCDGPGNNGHPGDGPVVDVERLAGLRDGDRLLRLAERYGYDP